jgi:shikimate 5-dehydrogenase
MAALVDGRTRIFAILGDPIVQVKSPTSVTGSFRARSRNAILIPVQVRSDDFDRVVDAFYAIENLDGLVVTVPHKFAAFRHCTATTDRAAFLRAVNVMRRNFSGGWDGDMCDGQGFVDAIREKGGQLAGRRALLLGAGGAGSAIGYALLESGVTCLAVHDADPGRQHALIAKLQGCFGEKVLAGTTDPDGFDVLANATPVGMANPLEAPIELERLRPGTIVGDVVTPSQESALIAAARAKQCITSTGHDMYRALQETMVDFLLAE